MNYIEKFGQVFSRISVVCWFLFYNLPSTSGMLCDWQMAWCMALIAISVFMYRVSQKNPPPPLRGLEIFSFFHKLFLIDFLTHLLYVPVYARLQIFIQLIPTLTKLCHIKRDYPVHIICSKCPPSAKTRTFRRLRKSIASLIVVCGKSL